MLTVLARQQHPPRVMPSCVSVLALHSRQTHHLWWLVLPVSEVSNSSAHLKVKSLTAFVSAFVVVEVVFFVRVFRLGFSSSASSSGGVSSDEMTGASVTFFVD